MTIDYYISELAMVAKTTMRKRSPVEESWGVSITVAAMAMTVPRMSMAIAGVPMVAIARVVSPISNTMMAVASMAVASMPTKSSRAYRSIACTEEGTKGT